MAYNPLAVIEGALFVAGDNGVELNELKRLFDVPSETLREHLAKLAKKYKDDPESGLAVVNFGDRFKIVTKPEHRHSLATLLDLKPKNGLPPTHFEVLAIVAYNQPCTRMRIEEIRGVASVGAIESLVEHGLISADRRDETVGHPILYEVTQKFFDLLGIRSLNDLPKLSLSEAQQIHSELFSVERYEESQE